jgi:hypothetical protein
MHHLVTMHHNQIYFIHISILTKYSDHVQLRSHFYNLSLAHNVHRCAPSVYYHKRGCTAYLTSICST